MLTTVVLVFMALSPSGSVSAVHVAELTDIRLCESVGNQLAAMAMPGRVKWTCIENPK